MTTSGLSLCSKNVTLALEILTSLALKKTPNPNFYLTLSLTGF